MIIDNKGRYVYLQTAKTGAPDTLNFQVQRYKGKPVLTYWDGTVQNTGEKVTPESVATLAEPFLRGTERIRTDHVGVGLGLAIAKSIAEAHDGTLTLTPRAAGGLCVTVQLPAASLRAGR